MGNTVKRFDTTNLIKISWNGKDEFLGYGPVLLPILKKGERISLWVDRTSKAKRLFKEYETVNVILRYMGIELGELSAIYQYGYLLLDCSGTHKLDEVIYDDC